MEKIKVTVAKHGTIEISQNTTLQELSQQLTFDRPILLAKLNNQLKELHNPIYYDCNVEFLDITDANGYRAYQRGVAFLMIYAIKTLFKNVRIVVGHSINKNYYCELPNFGQPLTEQLLQDIEKIMLELVQKNTPIEKIVLPLEKGLKIFSDLDMPDKIEMLKYRRTSYVNFYKLDWLHDYFYGHLPANAGCLDSFKLSLRSKGILLQFPSSYHGYKLVDATHYTKISEVFEESNQWARLIKIDTVGSLNNKLCTTGIGEVIQVTEALHEKKIANLADQIMHGHKRIVLIAGPSSSGKTTFASRLGVQLRVNGVQPYVISLDNYYVNRDQTPVDEDGKFDFETIRALDTEQINQDLSSLLSNERVNMPIYNFLTGKREYKNNYLKLAKNDVLIIEGIHGLNDIIGKGIPRENMFKIFISALTQINIDDHNRIPTTDTRLVRRIVRDHQFRGYSAETTINMWYSVMRGEGKYIFPFQEEADAFFNSALVYEMCVLKQFAEPLLFNIDKTSPAYAEAKRLIKFLDSFLGVSSEFVPPNSILREFVGGSNFAYAH
ncbi:MAG: nucleoside kinase [Firmicutes bacterium]|nr:nucleoside kinase [Bacillota bacterium]